MVVDDQINQALTRIADAIEENGELQTIMTELFP